MSMPPMSMHQSDAGDSMRLEHLRQIANQNLRDNSQLLNSNKKQTTTYQKAVTKITWDEFFAGGIGAMAATSLTSPLNVVITRLQSDFSPSQLRNTSPQISPAPGKGLFLPSPGLYFRRTFQLLSSLHRAEGWHIILKDLRPNVLSVVPSTAMKFYIYSNSKRIVSQKLFGGQEKALVQLFAAAAAATATNAATTPVWLVKTRLEHDISVAEKTGGKYKTAFDCMIQIIRQEGIKGLYRGWSASYLGVAEFSLHLTFYEQMKIFLARYSDRNQTSIWHQEADLGSKIGAAVSSKLLAVMVMYPFGTIRTRLHQAPIINGRLTYTSIAQCFRHVWKEEGFMSMYRGLGPHVLRVLPSTAILFGVFEAVMKYLGTSKVKDS